MNPTYLEKYAQLIVKTGVNLQNNQTLVINSPVECADITRIFAQAAYQAGAREVIVSWRDEQLNKMRYMNAPEDVFDSFPEWQKELFTSYAKGGAAFISIAASDPELMKDVPPQRMSRDQKARSTALREYMERIMSNRNTWCVVSIPTKAWAMKVFPQLSEAAAVEKLWEEIFKTVRIDRDDVAAAWDEHKANLKKWLDVLNGHRFQYLHYENALGTDLTIELPEGHIWMGGADYTTDGMEFVANMPTEEVFTLPLKTGVNGKVFSSKPLNFNGNRIDGFSLTFKDGKVVEHQAQKGGEILKELLDTDEGARYLGEVALVPYDSPISNSGILFYNTLFDENAACHLAVGRAYPVCLTGGENMSPEELEKAGVNDSLTHEDFMVGTKDLKITGIKADGTKVSVFEGGNFTF